MSEFAKKYRRLLEERKKIIEPFFTEDVFEEMINLLSDSITDTIKFLFEECTEEEFIWMSEIFPEVKERSNSVDFIEVLYMIAERYPEAVRDYYIIGSIKEAQKEKSDLRLTSGGYGEGNIELLKKHGIEYKINKVYENGVRVGDIPTHKNITKQRNNNQTWFPKEWSSEKIKKAGEHVLKLKKNQNRNETEREVITGIYDGVNVGVIIFKGIPSAVFPDKDQSEALKRRKTK